MTHSFFLLLKPAPGTATGEIAHQITGEEGRKMLADGTAKMLPDGILRQVVGKKPTYSRKDMSATEVAADAPAPEDAAPEPKKKASSTSKKG